MGSCVSAPAQSLQNTDANGGGHSEAQGHRRRAQSRDITVERTSLERRNTEAQDELLGSIGEVPKYRPHGTWSADPPLDLKELERMRSTFWETCESFGGRSEIWKTLRAVVDLGRTEASTSQAMIDSAEIRLQKNGDLIHGAYDNTGYFYKIPEYCLSIPTNLRGEAVSRDDIAPPPEHASTESSLLESRTPNTRPMVVRMSHNSRDIIVQVDSTEKVSSVLTKIKTSANVKQMRLMMLGKMLADNQTLSETGWAEGKIVQALVTEP